MKTLQVRQYNTNQEFFEISSLSRDDLIQSGFDVSEVSDEDMRTLAGKLGQDYSEQLFWGSLEIIAGEIMNIPKTKTQ